MRLRNILFSLVALVIFVFHSCTVGPTQNQNQTNQISTLEFYVSTNGNDANQGSKSSPFLSLTKALDSFYSASKSTNNVIGFIYVSAGIFTPSRGLGSSTIYITNGNISIIGGWDLSFSTNTNITVLDASNLFGPVFYISSVENVSIRNFLIKNSLEDTGNGGGVYVKSVNSSILSNIQIQKSTAANYGGGVYIENSQGNKFYLTISNGISISKSGGGAFITNSHDNQFYISVYSSSAPIHGGGICLVDSRNNQLNLSLTNNNSGTYGGGISIIGNLSSSNKVQGNISFNSGLMGGGISVINSGGVTIIVNAFENTSALGAGLYIENSTDVFVYQSAFTNNDSSGSKASIIFITNSTNSDGIPLVRNLTIYGTEIGGKNNVPIGIYEDGIDLTNHILSANKFVISSGGNPMLSSLYSDPDDGTGNRTPIANNQLSILNTSLEPKHDALVGEANQTVSLP